MFAAKLAGLASKLIVPEDGKLPPADNVNEPPVAAAGINTCWIAVGSVPAVRATVFATVVVIVASGKSARAMAPPKIKSTTVPDCASAVTLPAPNVVLSAD